MSVQLRRSGYLTMLLFGVILTGIPAVATGQELTSLQAGSRVRLRSLESGAKWLQGNLVHMGNDSLSLVTRASDTVVVATGSVTQLEVSRGRYSNTGQGLAIGAAVGGGLGLILGVAAATEECRGFICYEVGPEDVLAVTAILAAAGSGVGALIGSASHREHWTQASLPRVSARVQPLLGGVGVTLSLRF